MKVLIIGAGASGMMAALTAAQEHEVVLLERQSRVGRKLMATGNGRCNLTNLTAARVNYHGARPDFVDFALREFDVEATLDFFYGLGLLTTAEEDGRVYPVSDSANSVVDVLRLHLEQHPKVTILPGGEATELKCKKGGFLVKTAEQTLQADRVIVCCGGLAGGKLGGTDLGYKLLSSVGHHRTKLAPALVQLKTDTTYVRSLKGVRCQAEVRLGRERRRGELQFTEYGVSGPVIFSLSRAVEGAGTLVVDLLPDTAEEALTRLLEQRCRMLPELKAEDLLTGMLHNRLGRTVLRSCGVSLEAACGTLTDRKKIAHTVKNFVIPVIGTLSFDQAQVTAGGMDTSEFDPRTLQSRLIPGLYAAGEVLDIDGDCGGFNLQWAWSSGRLAGQLRGSL